MTPSKRSVMTKQKPSPFRTNTFREKTPHKSITTKKRTPAKESTKDQTPMSRTPVKSKSPGNGYTFGQRAEARDKLASKLQQQIKQDQNPYRLKSNDKQQPRP